MAGQHCVNHNSKLVEITLLLLVSGRNPNIASNPGMRASNMLPWRQRLFCSQPEFFFMSIIPNHASQSTGTATCANSRQVIKNVGNLP